MATVGSMYLEGYKERRRVGEGWRDEERKGDTHNSYFRVWFPHL